MLEFLLLLGFELLLLMIGFVGNELGRLVVVIGRVFWFVMLDGRLILEVGGRMMVCLIGVKVLFVFVVMIVI